MNINFNFSNLTSRYNLMSQLFGVKKNQGNGLLNPAGIFNAKNQKGMGMANKSVKSDKEIEEIIYESGMCVRGMIMNGKSEAEMHQMIGVSEEYRQKMFDECKRHFLQENGVANGNTTKRSEVFRAYQLSVKEGDRLKGTWSLQQYEKRQYTCEKVIRFRQFIGCAGLGGMCSLKANHLYPLFSGGAKTMRLCRGNLDGGDGRYGN